MERIFLLPQMCTCKCISTLYQDNFPLVFNVTEGGRTVNTNGLSPQSWSPLQWEIEQFLQLCFFATNVLSRPRQISKQHCRILCDPTLAHFELLNYSQNGTLVDSQGCNGRNHRQHITPSNFLAIHPTCVIFVFALGLLLFSVGLTGANFWRISKRFHP